MGRLTQKDEQGNWCLRGVRWEQLRTGQIITAKVSEILYGALWKLMEYEDTELDPEEVEELNTFDGSQAVQATVKLQEEQRKHRWIPVEERLPDNDNDVIVSKSDGIIDIAFWNGDVWRSLDSNYTLNVLAWTPLLEPYNLQN